MMQTYLLTPNEYNVYEVISALQKSIRQGREYEEQALFFALELANTKHSKILWNRLRIIASEDVGIVNNSMAILIDALNRAYDAKQESLYVAHAVLALCRSVKSRIVDDFVIVVKNNPIPKIPDYALDMHTSTGKFMGRGERHFIEVGSKLANESTLIKNIYRERAEKERLKKEA